MVRYVIAVSIWISSLATQWRLLASLRKTPFVRPHIVWFMLFNPPIIRRKSRPKPYINYACLWGKMLLYVKEKIWTQVVGVFVRPSALLAYFVSVSNFYQICLTKKKKKKNTKENRILNVIYDFLYCNVMHARSYSILDSVRIYASYFNLSTCASARKCNNIDIKSLQAKPSTWHVYEKGIDLHEQVIPRLLSLPYAEKRPFADG